ncbi:MAG: FtsQ-type POTRA domain-containing protein [Candidatus Paceibacterota bacterium]|jgi:hypothetical protein
MNYYRKPHRYKKRESVLKSKFFLFSLAGFIVLIGFIYLLCLSPFLQVEEIIVERESVEEAPGIFAVSPEIMADVKVLAENVLSKKFLFWDTKSMFFFDSGSLEKGIAEKYPELESVKVRKKWPDKIKIELARKEGVALLSTEEGFLLLDSLGEIFDTYLPGGDLPVLVKPDYFLESKEAVVSEDDLEKILYIEKSLGSLGIEVDNFLLFSEDKLIIKTAEGWEIYFTLQKDSDWQIAKLNAVLEEVVTAERRGDLEYIEVRFSNRVFPKYKD